MSILIKGMEMPKNCCGCVFSGYTPTGKIPFCKRTGKDLTAEVYFNKRNADCPLIPIPPHGRLGDLDAFESVKYELPNGQKAFNRGFHSGVQFMQRLIMDAPTIIPADKDAGDGV